VYTTGRIWIHVLPFHTYFVACKRLYYTFYFTRPKNSYEIITVLKEQFSVFTSISYLMRNGNWRKSNFQCVCIKCWLKIMINGCTASSTICKVPNYKYGLNYQGGNSSADMLLYKCRVEGNRPSVRPCIALICIWKVDRRLRDACTIYYTYVISYHLIYSRPKPYFWNLITLDIYLYFEVSNFQIII